MKSLFFLFILIINFSMSCRSMAYKCFSDNECPNNNGKFVSNNQHKDIYEGQLGVPPGFNLQIDPLLPHGFGKITYGPQIPGTERSYSEGDVYEGYWDWDKFNFPKYSGKGTYTYKSGTVIETEWKDSSPLTGAFGKKKFPDGTVISGIWNSNGYICIGNCTNGTGTETADFGEWYTKGTFVNKQITEGIQYNPDYLSEGKFRGNRLVSGIITCKSNRNRCNNQIRNYSLDNSEFSSNQIKIIYKD
ncbi:hypothetical protein JWG40_10325 [Leptospira sp. 201903074]|uniref:hypothetical protein n=1 Tax=Leptospira abararensis TaxID=2810036 RepID=UPI0019649D61|nr:hypothetical protein [Leptospira abararensis]MBM9547414.1 hypothetical protein [Leptospira abararensis]